MPKCDVQVFDKGDAMQSLSTAVIIAKALNVDGLMVVFESFTMSVSHKSNVVDLYEIYQLKTENGKLKKKPK